MWHDISEWGDDDDDEDDDDNDDDEEEEEEEEEEIPKKKPRGKVPSLKIRLPGIKMPTPSSGKKSTPKGSSAKKSRVSVKCYHSKFIDFQLDV